MKERSDLSPVTARVLLLLVLLVAVTLRMLHLGHGLTFHPDERHIVMVVERLSLDDPNPRSFAYGSFPFYLLWGVSSVLAFVWPILSSYDGLFYVGRMLAALCGVLTVALTYQLARQIFASRALGILASLLLACNPLHLQLSRFFTVDIILTTLTTAVLLLCVRVLATATWRSRAALAVCSGLALATKVSAISLALPIGLVTLLQCTGQRSVRPLFAMAAACVVALLVSLVAQPYAVLDAGTFIQHASEQVRMVRGEWFPPYTLQYLNTTPFLYSAEQMLRYTFGVPVALATLIGLVVLLVRSGRRFEAPVFVVVAWVVGVYFSTAGLQVKFPRYLLPLYPPLVVFAAFGVCWITARLRELVNTRVQIALRMLPILLALWALIGALAFVQIYRVSHVYVQASHWIYEHIPPGAHIVSPHWDDRLPLHLPGTDPAIYPHHGTASELPIYEHDSPHQRKLLSERIASADYVIFPTQRIPGSVSRALGSLFEATRLLQLLFNEELGFELIASFKVTPALGPLQFRDDLADESFTVYDHPKVWVFRNTQRLSPIEIERRVVAAQHREDLPSRIEMLLRSSDSTSWWIDSGGSELAALFLWFLALQLLSLPALLLLRSFSGLPDGGWGAAKALGFFGVGWLYWYAQRVGLLAGGASGFIWVVLLLLGGVAFFARRLPRGSWWTREALHAELIFTLSFFAWVVIRACRPEIAWGEKPMDLSFLQYFARIEELPPNDPWAAGHTMHYYYYGQYFFAQLQRVLSIDAGVAYNLAIASVGAMLMGALYSLLRALTRSVRWGALAALAVAGASNLEWVWLLAQRKPINFDSYWATSRIFTSPQINEYPIWSVLFADLHAHLIALPLVVLCIIALYLWWVRSQRYDWSSATLVGALLAILFGTNTWDFISICGVVIALLGARWVLRDGETAQSLAAWAGGVALVASVGIVPFVLASHDGARISWGWVRSNEFNTAWQLLRHLVIWLAPLLFMPLLYRGGAQVVGRGRLAAVWLAGTLPVLLSVVGVWATEGEWSWQVFLIAAPLGLLGSWCLMRASDARHAFPALLTLCAAVLMAGTEVLFLMDRMNTSFKFYLAIWLLLGSATVTVVARLLGGEAKPVVRIALGSVVGILGTASLVGSLLSIYVMTTFARAEGPRPALNGLAFLERSRPGEVLALRWLRERVMGTPVQLEAHGPAYQDFTRVTMYTGLPTVLGWEHHVWQRGLSRDAIVERKLAIHTVYRGVNIEETVALLRRYHVELIVVGQLERGEYGPRVDEKFARHPELFPELFRAGEMVVYGTPLTRPSLLR